MVLGRIPPELAVVLEERHHGRVRGLGERIELRVPEKDVGALLLRALEAGADVVSVTPHRVSLESIFLSAVEEKS